MINYPDKPRFKDLAELFKTDYENHEEAFAHDPAIFQDDDGMYYVFSTHGDKYGQVQIRKSKDLINWQTCKSALNLSELKIGAKYAEQKNIDVWAPDVIKGKDGMYWLYYSMSTLGSQKSCICLAKSDKVTGPYFYKETIIKSSKGLGPNAIDPNMFIDNDGKLYMVYGSFAGGVYLIELNADSGYAIDDGYGIRLAGQDEEWMAIEGPFIIYNEKTKYYYLFISYGNLACDYNIRIARSKTINGNYIDALGNDISLMTKANINEYGTKLLGGYAFTKKENSRIGWMAPGHNSAIHSGNNWFIVHHIRTYKYGASPFLMQIRKIKFNSEGWPVISPFRYAGNIDNKYFPYNICGSYLMILQGKDTATRAKTAVKIKLKKDGKITGAKTGNYVISENGDTEITLDNVTYKGFLEAIYDNDRNVNTLAISALGQGQSLLARRN